MDQNNKRIVLVTGAAGGLGTAMCKQLSIDGFNVVGNCRSKEKVAKWLAVMESDGVAVNAFEGDVTDYSDMARMVTAIETAIGPIDILVNNAGITRDVRFAKMTKVYWDAVINTNLNSVFNVTRQVINGMIERKFGRIINISSVNGQRGQFGQTNYSAAKAGIHGFTKSLAMETAKSGITVNTISPGYIGTDMVLALEDSVRDLIIEQIPVGRLGGTHEVAHLVSFLASDKADFITGANYAINGGQHVY